MDKYCLPDNYSARLDNSYFDDTPYKDEYQDEVYATARVYLDQKNLKSVLDIGTGSGYKLMKYFKDCVTAGVDLEPTVAFLKSKYPTRKWGSISDFQGYWGMIICSDVIEHIPDPDEFLDTIAAMDFKSVVFSTPDRGTLYGGAENLGMPSNPAHVREWNMAEFSCYIEKRFRIKLTIKIQPNTHMLICTKK